jgi:cellulose synthase (UDP-forming)
LLDFPIIAFALALCALLVMVVGLYAPTRPGPRALASAIIAAVICTYLAWRVPQLASFPIELSFGAAWTWLFAAVELACLADLLVHVLLMSRITDRRPDADAHERRLRALPPDLLPHVDVWIATYNEEWSILEKTLVGCKHLNWPADRLHIWVLDDGRRDWLRDRCEEFGVGYVRRPDNKGRKAGNHNHALGKTEAPYILSLDADFVPFPNILYRTLGFFEEPDVAIVQTPQCYYNVEPMRRNMKIQTVVPDELDMFYKVLQPSRDAWGASFYCGSSAVIRRAALEAIDGFETATDIEDQVTAIKLLANGWKTRFLAEKLSIGLAPESSTALHDQRNRWCRGSLQILFLRYGPFGRGLSLVHRLFFLQTYWILGSLGPVVFTVTPILVWLFGWKLFPVTQHEQVILLPIALFTAICTYLTWISQRTWLPVISPAFHLFMAVEMLPTAVTTLIKPFGQSLIRILPVTLKGSDARGGGLDVRTFAVLALALAALIGAMAAACVFSRTLLDHPLEIVALLVWSIYTLIILSLAMRCCVEAAPEEEHFFRVRLTATLAGAGGTARQVVVSAVSLTGAAIDTSYTRTEELPAGTVRFRVGNTGEIEAVHDPAAGPWIRFGALDDADRRELIRMLYVDPDVHRRPDFFPLPPVIRAVADRVLVS